MSQRHPLAVVAAAATMLAAFPLSTVFDTFTWAFYVGIAVIVVSGTAMLARTVRAPVWVQLLGMMASLLIYITFVFPSGSEFARLIPSGETFVHFNDLFVAAGEQIRTQAVPVSDSAGLLLLTTAGVGLMAILVDLAAVGIRRPALAGLPMLAIYSVPVAVLHEGLSVLPFVFSAAGYLWLLVADSVDRVRRFGRRFTGEGRDVDVWEPSPLSSAGRRLGVVGVVIAMVLPLAIPGMTSGLIDRFGNGGDIGPEGNGIGPAGRSVNLTVLLQDNLDSSESFDMVKVRTNDRSPFYLKFGVADQITANGFTNRVPQSGTQVTRGITDVFVPNKAGVTSETFRASVQTINFDMNLVPTYSRLKSTEGLDAQWLYDGGTEQIFSRRPNATINRKNYSFTYVKMNYSPAALRTAGSIAPQDAARERSSVPAVAQIDDLVRDLTTGRITEYDKVLSIYNHFSPLNGFTYSLSSEKGDTGSPILDFLDGQKGFCVQYAAAMAWLVKASGFPARVAFGFTNGSGNINGEYTLTNLNLHAWTEVFFPDFGWVPFDATPAGSVQGSVQSVWAPDTSIPSTPGVEGPETPDRPGDAGPSGSLGPAAPPEAEAGPPTTSSVSTWWLIAAAVLVVALFMLAAPAWRRGVLRRRRRSAGGPLIVIERDGSPAPAALGPADLVTEPSAVASARRDAHEAWAELLDTMIDYAVPLDDSETPRATAGRLVELPALGAAVRDPATLLARAEERARYALAPVRPEGLNEAVTATRDALRERATRKERLAAALLPRSVLLRWRSNWVTWLSGAVRRANGVRDAMATVSPRRLLTRSGN